MTLGGDSFSGGGFCLGGDGFSGSDDFTLMAVFV